MITGKLEIECQWCGLKSTIETTPYEAFKKYGTFTSYEIRFCKKCNTKHAHKIKAENT